MSGPFSIGDVTVLRVDPDGFTGWNYPSFVSTHRRLDDGTGTSGNEVIQSGSLPARRSKVSGNSYDRTDMEYLRSYNATKELVGFTDDHGDIVTCIVLDFSEQQVWPGYWKFDMELLEQD